MDLNILILVSYDMLIGVGWLENHEVILGCKDMTLTYVDEIGENKTIKMIP